ncbi:hypothetical protein ES332_A09G223700v1 [Gossypium tomentosum]|uniref:Uncharacterized protein n=1 Tax=Gossypium tomentosum TaxID=34277 RepID=A0A5D2P6Z2_GOSTO|nr:hypothetical protein ES332_A09G223700v1 [Gossypium tomentosum]
MDLLTSSLLCPLLIWLLLQAFNSIINGRKSSQQKLPPGPPRMPIIGNLIDLGDKPHRSFTKLAQIHGPVMSLKLGSLITVVVSSETMAKEILQKQDIVFSNLTMIDAIRACQHHEVWLTWIPVSPLWRTLRKVCNTRIFASMKVDTTQYLRRNKIQELIANVGESCPKGEAINIGQAAFNTTINLLAQEFRKIVCDIMVEAGKPNLADYFPLLKKIGPKGVRHWMTVHFDKLLSLFSNVFDERWQSRQSQDYTASNDVLDTLLDIIEGCNKTIVTNLLLLASVRSPLRKALLTSTCRKDHPFITAIASTIRIVAARTTRLNPCPNCPTVTPLPAGSNANLCGFKVLEGSQVLVNVWAIGKDRSIWNNPNSFMPERSLGFEIDVKGRDFGLIPFGAGRRIWPGLPLANRMLHLILGYLINCFDWNLEGGIPPNEMNMKEKYGIAVQMVEPLPAVLTLV